METPIGGPIKWSNPDSGNSRYVTPLREESHPTTGARCRRVEETVCNLDGATEQAHGTVCRDSGGRWRIVRWPDTPKIHAIIGGAV